MQLVSFYAFILGLLVWFARFPFQPPKQQIVLPNETPDFAYIQQQQLAEKPPSASPPPSQQSHSKSAEEIVRSLLKQDGNRGLSASNGFKLPSAQSSPSLKDERNKTEVSKS